jgi:hypothetical protein
MFLSQKTQGREMNLGRTPVNPMSSRRKMTCSSLALLALAAGAAQLHAEEPPLPPTPYMGGPVELVPVPSHYSS